MQDGSQPPPAPSQSDWALCSERVRRLAARPAWVVLEAVDQRGGGARVVESEVADQLH
jgi:hypothetical protein